MSSDSYNVWRWVKSWILEKHKANLVKIALNRSEQDLAKVALSVRSVRPTIIGKAFLELPDVRDYIVKLLEGCTIIKYIMDDINNNPNSHWSFRGPVIDRVMGEILDRDIAYSVGQAILSDQIFQNIFPSVKKQQKNLKKIAKIMCD